MKNLGKRLLYPIWQTPVFFRDDVYLTCSQKNVPASAQNNALKTDLPDKKKINKQKRAKNQHLDMDSIKKDRHRKGLKISIPIQRFENRHIIVQICCH